MKKIDEVSNLKVYDINHSLLKEYVKAIKDNDFKALVTRLNIKEEVAMKYTSKLENTVKELKNCSKCKGLYECKNAMNGCVCYPKVKNNDKLSFDYVVCKYKKEQIKQESNTSSFFNEPIAIKNAKMADIDLKDKKRAEVIKWIKNFYKEFQKNQNIKGLFLHGSFGSGKTYLIAALFNELAKKKYKCVIVYYPELLRSLKESFSDDFKSRIEELKYADLLLIDDIGAESVTSWSRDEILGTILQFRMDQQKTTFLTSNLNIEELVTHLSNTKNGVEIVKAKRIIERIKQLTDDIELVSENRRN